MKTTLLILASILICGNLSARETPRQVSGRVTDENGETLPYANILVKGTTHGTASDLNGNYRLEITKPGEYNLIVKYAGFAPFEQRVFLNNDTTINFRLKEDALNLNEVTVTATRTPKLLKDAPVITRVITSEDIKKINAVTVQDLLETELPGLEFTREMDGQTAIHMQGMSGKYVLFLIDGERMAGETLNNVDYNRLNAENIERIEIAITNHTDLEGMGGEEYFIERFDGRAWKGIPQPTAFVALGYPIFPNETRDDFSATLLPELKENPPGLYRVRKTVITGQGAGIVHYPLAATFYLSDNPEDYEEYTRFASRLHEPRPMAEFKGGREAMVRSA